MKPITLLFTTAFAVLSSACSETSTESMALKRYKALTEIYVNNPKSLVIQGESVKLANDSICVINFIAKTENGDNGYTTEDMEYVIVEDRTDSSSTGFYEAVYPFEDVFTHASGNGSKFRSVMQMNGDETMSKESTIFYGALTICKMAEQGLLPTQYIRARKVE